MALVNAPLEVLKPSLHAGPVVYIIHLHEPLKHARHYVGSTGDLQERMRCYVAGNADCSCFMKAVHRAGITWTLARIWTFGCMSAARTFEYGFKKSGKNKRRHRDARHQCPFCRAGYLAAARERSARRRAATA